MSDPMRFNDLRTLQSRVAESLFGIVRSMMPTNWTTAVLELDVNFSPFTNTRVIRHRLYNPVNGEELRDFPESLFETVTTLHRVSTDLNEPWKRSILKLPPRAPGGPLYEVSYEY